MMRAAAPNPTPLVEPATAGIAPDVVHKPRVSDTQLYLDGVTVSFDGFRAINNLALMVAPGELRTIIGPNGAGKTTMMDIITGKTRPDEGEVLFAGRIDLTKLDETEIANLGIGRKFQKPTVFENLTVFENFELALKAPRGSFRTLTARLDSEALDRIAWALDTVGLAAKLRDSAGALSHGQKQWLEIGMLLVQDTQLILLDEPVAGMTDAETKQTAELILSLKGERTLVVVEHDMEFVRDLGARVTVLHEGSVLAEGSIDHVQNDPRVIEVYLGR
ncbi:urea ABC transporter ATP-binding protein UrtD [Ferrovibrio sp.]|jgi:urea transport system ATP-binding protein|uniref:urea ABC transporter ATP-binding protein UrtD n=1 Tax=Ferrovibrio sp. TaxID=1917215 RepID=UPI0035B3F5B5